MGQAHGKQLLKWEHGRTWDHHTHIVQVRNSLRNPGSYSVESPMDLMRILGNADRHLNNHFKGRTSLEALLEEFSLIHCLTASLIPFLEDAQIGVDDEKRALAEKYLERNPEWQAFFMVK